MSQKSNQNLLSGLDLIILAAVFGLAITFTGILLPFTKTELNTQGQTNTSIPYADTSSDKSLQLKNVKFNSSSPSVPSSQVETCENLNIQNQVNIENQHGAN
jgi:hypothetical protein